MVTEIVEKRDALVSEEASWLGVLKSREPGLSLALLPSRLTVFEREGSSSVLPPPGLSLSLSLKILFVKYIVYCPFEWEFPHKEIPHFDMKFDLYLATCDEYRPMVSNTQHLFIISLSLSLVRVVTSDPGLTLTSHL